MWLRAVAGIALLVMMGGRQPRCAQGQLVIAKEGTGLYHWPGCPVVQTARA